MSNQTRKPWKITEYQKRGCFVSGVLRGQFGDHEATYPIINTPGVIDGLRVEMAANDFWLIAAAPEMLEALKEIVAISDREHSAWERARAVIARAESGLSGAGA